MSFIDEIKSAINKAEHGGMTEPAGTYRAILDELVEGLKGKGVGARIIVSPRDPRQLILYLHPLYRPNPGSPILRVFLDGKDVVVPGENPTRIETPEALKRWLLQFVTLPSFVESLHTLRDKTDEPVEARLCINPEMAYMKDDMLVAVTPEDQKKLAEVAENALREADTRIELVVERVVFPGNAEVDEKTKYAYLDSAGYGVAVESVTPVGDKLLIRGVVSY